MTRILVVDDEPDIVSTLQLILDFEGYDVLLAYDGREALDQARTGRPDLIITDIMMPRMDGLELCRALRAGPETRDIPIIVLSSIEPEGEVCWDAHVLKPSDVDALLGTVRAQLERGRER